MHVVVASKYVVKLKERFAKENNMAQRDDSAKIKEEFLSGYEDGTEFQKGRNKLYGSQVNKSLTNVEDVTSDMDKLRNPGKYASNAKSIVMPSPYLSGKVKGASDMAIAIEKEKDRNKTIPMTKEDAKVIKSNQFKRASDAMTDMKKGGAVKAKKMASGGKASQLAKANGIAVKGKSRGRII